MKIKGEKEQAKHESEEMTCAQHSTKRRVKTKSSDMKHEHIAPDKIIDKKQKRGKGGRKKNKRKNCKTEKNRTTNAHEFCISVRKQEVKRRRGKGTALPPSPL